MKTAILDGIALVIVAIVLVPMVVMVGALAVALYLVKKIFQPTWAHP